MSEPEELTEDDFWAGLSPEDIGACQMDVLLYGTAFVGNDPDGVKRRVPPVHWPEAIRPNESVRCTLARLAQVALEIPLRAQRPLS